MIDDYEVVRLDDKSVLYKCLKSWQKILAWINDTPLSNDEKDIEQKLNEWRNKQIGVLKNLVAYKEKEISELNEEIDYLYNLINQTWH